MDIFLIMIYAGGVNVAYRRNRNTGRGRITSTVESLVWPINVGRNIARALYTTDEE